MTILTYMATSTNTADDNLWPHMSPLRLTVCPEQDGVREMKTIP